MKIEYCFLILLLTLKSFSQDRPLVIDTDDFETFINEIKNKGRTEYVGLINKLLDDNNSKYILDICDLIVKDQLTECKPTLKNFIINTNRDNSSACPLNALAILADESEKYFIIDDFQKRLDGKFDNYDWMRVYIYSFEKMEIDNAHDLIEKAYFDWSGINYDFIRFPILFEKKKQLEQQYKSNFPGELSALGYSLNKVLAFIDNTNEVAQGKLPNVRYIIEIELPYDCGYHTKRKDNKLETASIKKINEFINLPERNITLKYNDGTYYKKIEERFSNLDLTISFMDYLIVYPNSKYRSFFIELEKRNYLDDYDKYYLNEFLKD